MHLQHLAAIYRELHKERPTHIKHLKHHKDNQRDSSRVGVRPVLFFLNVELHPRKQEWNLKIPSWKMRKHLRIINVWVPQFSGVYSITQTSGPLGNDFNPDKRQEHSHRSATGRGVTGSLPGSIWARVRSSRSR